MLTFLGLLRSRVGRYAAALALLAALAGGVWWHGRLHERGLWQAERAALIADRREAAARIIGMADRLAATEAARDDLAATLQEAANADAEADRVALPARSVRRIDRQ
ncbi:MAG: hypothetical protein H5U20_03580 [Rhodobacteraceae bacterium]|nr:hypothetical protein [Paracoccaceae bacterium]